ncbi:MAG: ABC transporter permease [Bdellovibrionota bacterium]
MNFRQIAKLYLVGLIFFLVLGSVKAFQIYNELHSDQLLSFPNSFFWMGSDSLGRDLWSRLIIGGIISLLLSCIATIGALCLGVILGVLMGLSDKYFDRWGLQFVNVYQSIPSFVVASVLCLSFQNTFRGLQPVINSIISLILCLIFTHWVSTARLVRAEVKRMKIENFVLASISMGASQIQILRAHLWLYLKKKLALLFGFIFPSVLFYESFLSFVGFGLQAPLTSWGLLIQEGWRNLGSYPHLIFIPMFFVVSCVWAVNTVLEISREDFN